MTAPTMTYDVAAILDTYATPDAVINGNVNGGGGDGAATSEGAAGDDWIKLTAEPDEDPADEFYLIEYHDVASETVLTHPCWMCQYKTGDSSSGMGLTVRLEYSDAVTMEYLIGTSSVPVFSDTWTVASGTLTETTKTHDQIHIKIDDYPDTTADGVDHYAWVDFVMLYGGTFTFPFLSHSVKILTDTRMVTLDIPGRVGDITQYLGMKSPIIELRGVVDMDTDWKDGPTGTDVGDAFYSIWFQAYNDPWVWLTVPDTTVDGNYLFQGKVHPLNWEWTLPGASSPDEREFVARFVKADTCDGSNYGYRQYWGLSL